ncbi:MAG: hypothetical protein HYZ50_15280 [Deltaproteobacteria bacterium]|nr:hypothetical protein [Deltaproteobacteria bacterium]
MRKRSRTLGAALVVFVGLLVASLQAHASALVPPAASAQEISLAGNVVAKVAEGSIVAL